MQAHEQQSDKARISFLLRNFVKGLIWLAVIIGGYLFLKKHYDFTLESLLGAWYNRPFIIYLIFFISETIFGIIPPELFMIWSLRDEMLYHYILYVAGFSLISYLAGIIGYFIGAHFSSTRLYRIVRVTYLKRFEKHLIRFGGFLVVVAALTPLPFAGICMLMGTIQYSYRRFLIIALTRFLRFGVYAIVVWQANVL